MTTVRLIDTLHKAVEAKDADAVKKILEDNKALDLNSKENFISKDPMTTAITKDGVKDISASEPILNSAVRTGNQNIVEMLLEAKANPNIPDTANLPSLCTALESTPKDKTENMITLLIKHKADIAQPIGLTPITLFVPYTAFTTATKTPYGPREEKIQKLLLGDGTAIRNLIYRSNRPVSL